MIFNRQIRSKILYEELHIRHLNLLIDLKNYQFNNWFYKMAIINTFDDLKIFLSNLEKNKYKCIIAIENKKIIGYVYTNPLNNKKSCLKINSPEIIGENINISRRELILKLIKTSIDSNNLNTSNWIINADINDNELISCSRELGFQPLQEITLWKNGNIKFEDKNEKDNNLMNLQKINKSNIKKFLNFVRSSENIIMRNLLDLEQKDILKRSDKKCGLILNNEEIIFGILKDISYENKNVYSLIRGILWDSALNKYLSKIVKNNIQEENNIIFKTYSNDKILNSFLSELNLIEIKHELLLVRNTLIKRDFKTENSINKSWESLLEKINPQGNAYPSPMPLKLN
tara:strand:- start:1848 stop:2879 length:1032 start_codon:yes stop_codon:yes gene_type:complete